MSIKHLLAIFLILISMLFVTSCSNDKKTANIKVCFTPGENCTNVVLESIANAKESIYMQADSFNDTSITNAILDAKKRGVDIRMIVDKSLKTQPNSPAISLYQYGIPVWIDNKVSEAHNNVVIVDNYKVITGSFSFTLESQEKNAANMLIIDDPAIVKRYADNWQSRVVVSQAMAEAIKTVDNEASKVDGKMAHNEKRVHKAKQRKRKSSGFWRL